MQEDKVYEYAVIRVVPKVEREEFFNVGLILFSKKEKYIRIKYHVCPKKFGLMYNENNIQEINENLENFKDIAEGKSKEDSIAQLDIPERFRWLTAVKSSVIQTSRPRVGKSKDLDKTFKRLFSELVI